MPLIQGRSKKSISKNIETEMEAGKPHKQSIAIALSVQRKNKGNKKYAEGGDVKRDDSEIAEDKTFDRRVSKSKGIEGVHKTSNKKGESVAGQWARYAKPGSLMDGRPEAKRLHKEKLEEMKSMPKPKLLAEGGEISAKSEKRPMPDDRYNDSKEASRNSGDKPANNDNWESKVTEKQAAKGKTIPIKQPPFAKSGAPFSVRDSSMRDDEKDLIDSKYPSEPQQQPPEQDDEEGADRHGTAPHKMKMMSEGGDVAPDSDSDEDFSVETEQPKRTPDEIMNHMDELDKQRDSLKKELYAAGGMINPKDHGQEEMEHSEESDMEDRLSPGEHGEQPDSKYDEEDADGSGTPPHRMKYMADGGEIEQSKKNLKGDKYSMPESEKPRSVTEAIMKQRQGSDESMIDLDNKETNSQTLRPNNRKAANSPVYDDDQLEDQPKDSNEHGDSRESDSEDEQDQSMISLIRARLKSKRES